MTTSSPDMAPATPASTLETATMTAIARHPDGSLAPIRVARPTPGPTEVLIETSAVGINPVDVKTRQGTGVAWAFSDDRPMIPGWDVAGTVVEVGDGVTRFAVGDRVFGMPRFPHPAEAYAEYVVAGAREIAHAPTDLTDVEAAALPLAALTAWQALEALEVGPGDRVLIHAAAGGVGHLAVQIAKARGAEVWGTASERHHDTLRELGADTLIDYRSERFEDIAHDMDAVLDLVGSHDYPTRSIQALRRGGRMIVVPSSSQVPSPELLDAAGVTAHWILVEPDYAALEEIAALADAGSLRVTVAETRPLAQMDDLHQIAERGGPLGKIVATVR